jgi:hypothetical protein
MPIKQSYSMCRVGLSQLVRFPVVKLIHPDLNFKFDINIIFTANYSFSDRFYKSQNQINLVFRMCS